MEDKDKKDCCDTEPVKELSVAAIVGIVFLTLTVGLAFISTVLPLAMAWSKYITNYFGL